jgi:hypothetical protein
MENKIENNDKTTRNYPTEEDSLKDAFSAWAPRYKVIGGNLCMEMNSKQGNYDKKLCNFTPRLLSEITVDDGVASFIQ